MRPEIDIYDLDGTLTYVKGDIPDTTGLATYSLWNVITDELVVDKDIFEKRAMAWKEAVKSHADKVQSSKDMTEVGLSMFKPENRSAKVLQAQASQIVKFYLQHGVVQLPGIHFLVHRLRQGVTCIISTASYEDGAIGFIKGISEARPDLLPPELISKIKFVGTIIDWPTLKVTHMNADHGKIVSLERVLGESVTQFSSKIAAVFGDDPEINDRALLTLGKYSFGIPTIKNGQSELPKNCVWCRWNDIWKNRDTIATLHAGLLQLPAKERFNYEMWKFPRQKKKEASGIAHNLDFGHH